MDQPDREYYRARAQQELVAAQRATCTAARLSHDQLAAMYRFKALMLDEPIALCVRRQVPPGEWDLRSEYRARPSV